MSRYARYVINFIFLMSVFASAHAVADCVKDGSSYPVGTEMGGFICTENGWQAK